MPESALIRTSSLGSRLATATVRVRASTTTPSGAAPTVTVWPMVGRRFGGAVRGSAAGGRGSAEGRTPPVGTPGGRMPVVVGVAVGVAIVPPDPGERSPPQPDTAIATARRTPSRRLVIAPY